MNEKKDLVKELPVELLEEMEACMCACGLHTGGGNGGGGGGGGTALLN